MYLVLCIYAYWLLLAFCNYKDIISFIYHTSSSTYFSKIYGTFSEVVPEAMDKSAFQFIFVRRWKILHIALVVGYILGKNRVMPHCKEYFILKYWKLSLAFCFPHNSRQVCSQIEWLHATFLFHNSLWYIRTSGVVMIGAITVPHKHEK